MEMIRHKAIREYVCDGYFVKEVFAELAKEVGVVLAFEENRLAGNAAIVDVIVGACPQGCLSKRHGWVSEEWDTDCRGFSSPAALEQPGCLAQFILPK